MKVKIGPYKNWFGPYQLAEKLMFWVPKEKDEHGFEHTADRVHKFGEWLAHGSIEPEAEVGEVRKWGDDRPVTWLARFLSWIHSKKEQKIEVRIDPWDTWSMDHTLAHIVLPMLKQLKATKHGAPFVDNEDVPKELQMTLSDELEYKTNGSTDDKFFERWNWVMDEMIFAFEEHNKDDGDSQFYSGEHDIRWKKLQDGNSEVVRGPKDTFKVDKVGLEAYNNRKANGFRLFGKYYQNLWD